MNTTASEQADSTGTLISARTAVDILTTSGIYTHGAWSILRAGVAGTPVRVGGAHLFERSRVVQIADTPLTRSDLLALNPVTVHGIYVIRLHPRTPVDDPDRTWSGWDPHANTIEQDDALRRWHNASTPTRSRIDGLLDTLGIVPIAITVGTFVVAGRDCTGVDDIDTSRPVPRISLSVRPAGDWYRSTIAGTRLASGRGPSALWWPPAAVTSPPVGN